MPSPSDPADGPAPRVVSVLPDVRRLRKTFDYLVPADWPDDLQVGTEVRVDLHGRRVGGWVVADHVEPPAGLKLLPLAKRRGLGPAPEVVALASWAAWRWAGPVSAFLGTASPPTAVAGLPAPAPVPPPITLPGGDVGLVDEALCSGVAVVRHPPGLDRFPFIAAAAAESLRTPDPATPTAPRSVLVVCPSIDVARRLATRLRRTGLPVALVADDRPGVATSREWASAAAGGRVVVGARAAAWAPAPGLAAAVVVDEHDEALQEESAPTWHARDVVLERARRAGAPAILLSPCPTLEALRAGTLLVPSRRVERSGWPVVDIVDRRAEDPATASSLISPALAAATSRGARVVCVLNRTGRARLLACRNCGELARCDACGAAVGQAESGVLRCPRCDVERPVVCLACGSASLRVARAGVGRVREELEALVGEPVAEVTAAVDDEPGARVLIGTEAVLNRVGRADVVAFLDFDQEITAPRFRAAEQAFALIARAARLLGPREAGGRLLVQTRVPAHPVLAAVLHADPGRLSEAELEMRRALRFPPFSALASVSGPSAEALLERLPTSLDAVGIELLGPRAGAWLLRAPDHEVLADALAEAGRPPGRVRVEVDPLRA